LIADSFDLDFNRLERLSLFVRYYNIKGNLKEKRWEMSRW